MAVRAACSSAYVLTAFGSAWYHAQPSDATLVWDRLPMALGFAGLVAGTLTDRVHSGFGVGCLRSRPSVPAACSIGTCREILCRTW